MRYFTIHNVTEAGVQNVLIYEIKLILMYLKVYNVFS